MKSEICTLPDGVYRRHRIRKDKLSLLLLIYCLQSCVLSNPLKLKNNFTQLEFDKNQFHLTRISSISSIDRSISRNFVIFNSSQVPLWTLQLVRQRNIIIEEGTQFAINANSPGVIRSYNQSNSTSLTLQWSIPIPKRTGNIEVHLIVSLPPLSPVSNIQLVIYNKGVVNIGLWQVQLSIGGLTCLPSDQLFFPRGFGVLYSDPARLISEQNAGVQGHYPSSWATMQFVALGAPDGMGIYFAAHDPFARPKILSYRVTHPQQSSLSRNNNSSSRKSIHPHPWPQSQLPRHLTTAIPVGISSESDHYSTLAITLWPDNAGLSWSKFSIPHPIVLGVVSPKNTPGSFMGEPHVGTVLKGCPERQKPPCQFFKTLSEAKNRCQELDDCSGVSLVDTFDVEGNNTTHYEIRAGPEPHTSVHSKSWLRYEGFPPVWWSASQLYREWANDKAVWTKAGPLTNRKDYPNWYLKNNIWLNTGWQCVDVFNETEGNPKIVHARMDALANRLNESLALHWYEWQQGPSMDPTQRYKFDTKYPDYFAPRKGFKEAIKALQKKNVKIFPYINGRIFDQQSNSWRDEFGAKACSKQARPEFNVSKLSLHKACYGSGACFAIANPYSPYWQKKISQTATTLVQDWGADGVYIDQLAHREPALCWDPAMGHTLGGGTYWREGLDAMISQIDNSLRDGYSDTYSVMVTESNAEANMDTIKGFLTLMAFRETYWGSSVRLVPAFPAVYGGYYVSFGREFTRADFHEDHVREKLGTMFVYGAQLGWFSLGGTDNPGQDCGPMGVYDLLMSSEHDKEILFLQHLSQARTLLSRFLVLGRLMTPPRITQLNNTIIFPALRSAVWQAQSSEICVVLVSISRNSTAVSIVLDMRDYGFTNVLKRKFQVTKLSINMDGTREQKVEILSDYQIKFNYVIQPWSIMSLILI